MTESCCCCGETFGHEGYVVITQCLPAALGVGHCGDEAHPCPAGYSWCCKAREVTP